MTASLSSSKTLQWLPRDIMVTCRPLKTEVKAPYEGALGYLHTLTSLQLLKRLRYIYNYRRGN